MTRLRIVWGGSAIVVIAVVSMYAVNPYHVASLSPLPRIVGYEILTLPSPSMEPTIPAKSVVLENLMTLRNRDPDIGEIIVFRYPPNPDIKYMKRVVATGGQTVEMRLGVVYLDGQALQEPYLPATPATEMLSLGVRVPLDRHDIYYDMAPVRVPAGSFFVLGDNRGIAADSRLYGFVPRDLVVGTYVRTVF